MSPKRIQRQRIKGWRMPPDAIYVGRPTRWGNPFIVGAPYFVVDAAAYRRGLPLAEADWHKYTAADAVSCYERWLPMQVGPSKFAMTEEARIDLGGHDLVCWCPLDQPCHGDVLLRIANGGAPCT